MSGKYFYISTPAYYVNDSPHIGHFYTTLVADVVARFKRLDGFDVKFATGTDEHGQKVAEAASKGNMPALRFADQVSATFRELVRKSGFCCTDFVRTTEERHRRAVVELWDRLNSRGQIYRGYYSGFYSVRDETFYQEKDLVDGRAPTGAEVIWSEEPGYFFKLSEWQGALLRLYRENPSFVVPSGKLNEVVSFVESGLKDLSISRSKKNLSWGIDVPGDQEHLIYVWVDALSYYLSLTGFPDINANGYVNYWQGCGCTHVVGKDILRFHAVYWPALLMAAGLPLPKQIVAHGWWLNEGQKISKSLGNVIDPFATMDEYGLENLRYFLLSETPIGNDASFSSKGIAEKINCDLANNFGNLVMRTISLAHKECAGEIPVVDAQLMQGTESLPDYECILARYKSHMECYQLCEAIKFVLSISASANEYIAKRAPWKLFKEDRPSAEAVMYKLLEYIRCIGLMLTPIMPAASEKILEQVAVPRERRNFRHFSEPSLGGKLPDPMPIFPRYDL